MERPPKFVFHCQKCGRCCERKAGIPIYLSDIERWSNDGTIYRVLPHLSISGQSIQMEREDGRCKMYDSEKKECEIYESRPISCRAYPLGYNGKNFVLRDKECPGLNKEGMTREELDELKDAARNDYDEESRMLMMLPALQSIVIKDLEAKSRDAYEGLSDEQKERLKDAFGEAFLGDER